MGARLSGSYASGAEVAEAGLWTTWRSSVERRNSGEEKKGEATVLLVLCGGEDPRCSHGDVWARSRTDLSLIWAGRAMAVPGSA
jgi:hypothetical protein